MIDSEIQDTTIYGDRVAIVTLDLEAVEAIASWIPDGDAAKREWSDLAERLRNVAGVENG